MRRVRLVIADRRPIVLQGFASLLGAQPDFEVVACCLDGASCLAAIRSLTPDVVLLEDGFTDVTASDILAVADDEGLSSRLVFFTATVACGDLARALATGACGAISMNAKPEALLQSLRLEKSGSDLARVGNEANGIASFGNNVLGVLTVNERTIMDLVAEGLSDSEIARMLGVSLEIVRIHIDHAREKLRINSRTELAALALSRRYGAMSILAAAIWAALDDSPGHAATESFTVMAANGCAEVVTIKISRKEAVSGGTPARGASKDRAGAASGTSSPTGKLVDPVAEIAASQFVQAALNAPRSGSSSYNIFMVAAFAALIYEVDGANHAVQAFDFGDDIVTSSTASDANGPASALPGCANFGGTAVYGGAFAFEFAQGDTIATDGSELYVGNAHAEDRGSGRETAIPRGSGTIDVVAAAANEAAQRDPTQTGRENGSNQGRSQSDLRAPDNNSEAAKLETAGDSLNHGQSQKALHESDDGSVAAKGHAKHETLGDGSNHGQSQKALHESDDGSVAAKGHAKHETLGDGSNHGQSQKALQEFDNGSVAAKGHANHETLGDGANHGQSQKALQESDNGSVAAKGHAKHETLGDGSNHGQSQKALQESDNGSVAAKGHAKHETLREDSNRGQAHGDLQTFEDGSAAGKQHARHPQAGDLDSGKPQHHIPMASVNSANDAHSALKIKTEGKGGPSSDNADQAKSAVGTDLGDSFHFKSGADNTSSGMYDLQQLSHGNGKAYGDGQHAVAREGPEPVQDADGIDISNAHHDHSWHANLHAAHDLIV
ncbi:response regulator transcription factor [Bradyrhizobium japonicum]|uniref:response regulator transcription factor n=1 Tax=Bradyrhizobium japonicum TaxID=375 RepID=UPI001E4D87D9|nr:response regulator transcription factor [Bradyrhizobium japonicum]MCD9112405.1 response regulator transcription factor [Bradyrhizobium japonicum]MCD9824166.1 response regulator transcription factor [Bradyrhizobium japonicum]MCD9896823.1 response regulator transcription factor [Bradyrhizobium japonicum]MCD9912432.1 response regulator transcription factor [Bradyrhizobium japonicum]MCS3978650.1 DNA-binding NarL/FixJ family response regulator [Bradyrhizobium japonicum]